MAVLAGRRGYGFAGRPDSGVAVMLIFRRAMIAAETIKTTPLAQAESAVLGALAEIGYTVPTPIPASVRNDVVSLTLYIRNYAHESGRRV